MKRPLPFPEEFVPAYARRLYLVNAGCRISAWKAWLWAERQRENAERLAEDFRRRGEEFRRQREREAEAAAKGARTAAENERKRPAPKTAEERERRLRRIEAALARGESYAAIARAECRSYYRIRQLVAQIRSERYWRLRRIEREVCESLGVAVAGFAVARDAERAIFELGAAPRS